MKMYDVICRKRSGAALSQDEINFFIHGYTEGTIPDYQAAALLMAIYFKGMNSTETAQLTAAMSASGDTIDLSSIPGIKLDKHSTGGVGDKTTLLVAPIVAACGVPVAKIAGRGLGHTGGTLDKLESIPGLSTTMPISCFLQTIQQVGVCIAGQTADLAPADKKLYALRDVTATVENLSLIVASIMSKKIAVGADAMVLDVKTGSGAFMKSFEDSLALAQEMVSIGHAMGRKTIALITDMDRPLGLAIGNSLEVLEAAATLRGNGPEDLRQLSVILAANMLHLANKGNLTTCQQMAQNAIDSGKAYEVFCQMITAQGGDATALEDTKKMPQAQYVQSVHALADGIVSCMDTQSLGTTCVVLGAGRESKDDSIDYSAGIVLCAPLGTAVQKGDVLAQLYTNNRASLTAAQAILQQAICITHMPPQPQKLVQARISIEGTEVF